MKPAGPISVQAITRSNQLEDCASNLRGQGFPPLDHFVEIRRECGKFSGRVKGDRSQASSSDVLAPLGTRTIRPKRATLLLPFR
jgi:hypothetical protein